MSTTAVTSSGLEDFSGELLAPGDPAYDEVRRVWNGAIDRRPAFIARCRTTGDVTSAVVFARRHDLPARSGAVATACPATPCARAA